MHKRDRRWILRNEHVEPHAFRGLADALLLSPIAARVLLNRGVEEAAAARIFMKPVLNALHDPFLFRDMERAASRIRAAIEAREPILVFGDYDVDGITGAALLTRMLEHAGARVQADLPCRLKSGYGIRAARVARAADEGIRLIIAVDNGITAFDAAAEAARRGVGLIVADHHECRLGPDGEARLPEALAIINPKVPGETYPFAGLCGCAVAFKLAWAVATTLSSGRRASPEMRAFLLDALSLVAIATVADAMPLIDENRPLVAFGLGALERTKSPGLRALLRISGAEGALDAEAVAYRIGPRLNACGRLGNADLGLALLTAPDHATANALAERLEDQNRRRRALDRRTLDEALAEVEPALERSADRAIVLWREGWHPGVLGIIAGRLAERFYRPAIVVALPGAGEAGQRGRGRGSARSVPGVDIGRALAACEDLLIRYGGHAQAAGLEIDAANLPAFAARLGEALRGAEERGAFGATPPLEIDAEVPLEAVSRRLVGELGRIGPFGEGNPPPVLSTSGVVLAEPPRAIGRDKDHLALRVRQSGVIRRAIGFGFGARIPDIERAGGALSLAYRPIISSFRGEERVELAIEDIRTDHPWARRAAPEPLWA